MTSRVQRHRIKFAAALFGLFFSSLIPVYAGLFSQLHRPFSLARERVHSLNDQIGALLLKMPRVSSVHISASAVDETYLLIIRHYYQTAMHTRDASLRGALMLKADRLRKSYPVFATLIAAQFANPPLASHVESALKKFQKASVGVNAAIINARSLNTYTAKLLGPLAPLMSVETPNFVASTAVIWPVYTYAPAPAYLPNKAKIPPIAQTLASLEQVNITPHLRHIFRSVLTQIQAQLADNPHNATAAVYYRVILQCLRLAQHLQQVSILSLNAQAAFNHRLMLGLLFFKDPRTRNSAIRRLEFIGRIVHSMELIAGTPMSAVSRRVMDRRVHQIMSALDQSHHPRREVHQLDAINSFLVKARKFSAVEKQSPPAAYRIAWHRVVKSGEAQIVQTVHSLRHGVMIGELGQAAESMEVITGNLKRLSQMPQMLSEALLYKPIPQRGASLNLARWAVHIGMAPGAMSEGAQQFDRFRGALKILAGIHLQMLHSASAGIQNRLSSGRFTLFAEDFKKTQRGIINSLATRKPAPAALVEKLDEQMRLLRATSRLAWMLSASKPIARMNLWGGWHLSTGARHALKNQLEQAVAHRYQKDTGLTNASDAWISFSTADAAITSIYRAAKEITPKLTANPALWSTAYLQTTAPPPAEAICGFAWPNIAEACMLLNSSAANNGHGHFQAASYKFQQGVRVLARANIPAG